MTNKPLSSLTDPQLALLAARAQGWEAKIYNSETDIMHTRVCELGAAFSCWKVYDPANRWEHTAPLLEQIVFHLAPKGRWLIISGAPNKEVGVSWEGHDGQFGWFDHEITRPCRAITLAYIQAEAERQGKDWREWLP